MDLTTFCDRLDDRLRTGDHAPHDASVNGLQVGPDEADVERVAFAVDGVRATFESAIEWGADAVVTHHGVSWGGIDRVTGRHYGRIAPLIRNDVALYASHLPLDGHPELGNAAGLAALLGLTDTEPFGPVGPVHVGRRGRAPEPFSPGDLRDVLADRLDTGGQDVRVLDFGPDTLRDVAVATGDGSDWLDEAARVGADVLVTGEAEQRTYHEAREAGVTVVLAGHYATETFGVRSLQSLAEEWGLETTFVDHPTGL